MAISSLLIDNLNDKSNITISKVVEEVRKNYKDGEKNSITGITTVEDVEDDYNRFPGVIIYKGKTAEGLGEIIVNVDETFKWITAEISDGKYGSDKYTDLPKITITGSTYEDVNGVYYNSPDLTGFDPESTYIVTYDDNFNEIIAGRIDRVEHTNTIDGNTWYDYANKKWANVVTVNQGQIAYWVWIPRYIYQEDTSNTKSNIKFTKNVNGVEIYTDSSGEHTLTNSDGVFNLSTNATPDNYKLSDAFEFNNNHLSGYWMSKYEVQDEKYYDNIIVTGTKSKTIINTNQNNKTDTYTVFVDGVKEKDDKGNVISTTLPYTIDANIEKDHNIVLVNNTTGKIISLMAKGILAENVEIDLGGFNPDCTYYVTYNGDTEIIGDRIKVDANGNPTNKPDGWYDYGDKKWANIVTVNQGQISYWTYIPRYEYREYTLESFADVAFIPISKTKADNGFKISDAFKFNGEDLKGYWMSKYEVQDESYYNTVILAEKNDKILIDLSRNEEGAEYYLFLNGEKQKDFKTKADVIITQFPYEIDKSKVNGIDVMLVNRANNKIISLVAKGILPEDIEVDLSGFNLNNTYYVTYDGDTEKIWNGEGEKITVDSNGIPTNKPNGWYDYRNKKWANIVTINNGLTAYWTYIPRYEYREFPGTNPYANAVFIPKSKLINQADNGFKISEAFKFNGQELRGYWVSKYEVQD